MDNESYRSIPPINQIVRRISDELGVRISPELALKQARVFQQAIREHLPGDDSSDPESMLDVQIGELESLLCTRKLSGAINATGIIVHTNLGRAAVSESTAHAMREAATNAVPLEVEPSSGQRGGRMREISSLLQLLTGAQGGLVVNNNAAAVLLVLTALAANTRVAVSRAEAVEIGGGFRIPDVLAQSGATMVEVGTTNRTYAVDYAKAAESGAEIFLRIHPSNFSISGFVATPSRAELRHVADASGALLIEDLGSGTLVRTEVFGLDHDPTVQESLDAGTDVVMFSGDKLLGGPQAGVICGRQDLITRISSHPLARALRADKTTLAGIAETLRHFVQGDYAQKVPVWMMISISQEALEARADRIVSRLSSNGLRVQSVPTVNYVGGGSLPGQSLPGCAIKLLKRSSGDAPALAQSLRLANPMPVFARIEDDSVFIELRTVMPDDDKHLTDAIGTVLSSATG